MTFFLWTWLLNTCTIVGAVSLGTYLLTIWAQELLGKTEQDLKAKYGAKWALVTGGSSGIGLALVNRLASQGISVVIVAYPDALLPKAIETLSLKYPSVEFRSIALDLSTPTAADVIAKDTEDLDINLVFNNAGYIKPGLFATSPLPTLLANYNTNATVTIAITHLFLNRMLAKGQKGLLCFTGSSGGFIPGPMSSIYSSTKAWMTNFVASLAAETASEGIDCMVVHPSPIASNFYNNASGMSALAFVKKHAALPDIIASTVLKLAGKTPVVDQGAVSVLFKLVLKVLDWNLLAEIMVKALPYNGDFQTFKKASKKTA